MRRGRGVFRALSNIIIEFLAKIVNGFQLLTIITKKLQKSLNVHLPQKESTAKPLTYTPPYLFSCRFCGTFQNRYFLEDLQIAISGPSLSRTKYFVTQIL